MRYRLQIELHDKNSVVETRRITFSEDRWLTARIQALTVLADCYSESQKLLGLYLQYRDRQKMASGVWKAVPRLRAVLNQKDFDKPIFDQNIAFEQLKQNLKREHHLYTLFSKHKLLVEQVQLEGERSIELIKGTNKLLSCFFK